MGKKKHFIVVVLLSTMIVGACCLPRAGGLRVRAEIGEGKEGRVSGRAKARATQTDNGQSVTLGFTCPVPCQCSKTGTSVNCNGKGLTVIPSGLPPMVEVLYLDNNKFTTLEKDTLANLSHLTKVYFRNNQIHNIKAGAFHNLTILKELYFSNNYIAQVQPDAFQDTGSLSLLNMQANKMTSVPDLSSLTGLKKVVLEANQIKNCTFPHGFAKLKFLSSIVLSNNNISQLTNATFAVLANSTVRQLELSRNNLRNVSTGALKPLSSLQSLKIGLNPLNGQQLQNLLQGLRDNMFLEALDINHIELGGVLPSVSFSILSKTPLKMLNFKNNKVGKIPAGAFADLPKLIQLVLSDCQIQEVADSAFMDLPQLQMLYLNNNFVLSVVPKNLPSSLQKLYLQYNKIARLESGDFQNLGQLRELYLSNNNMHEVSEESFLGLSNLRVLHLQNNMLSYIPKQLFAPFANLATLSLKTNNIKNLDKFSGAMDSLTTLTSFDMSDNQCSFIPFDYLSKLVNLVTLNLDNNNLGLALAEDKTGRLLGNLSKLQRLGLASNNLWYIHDAQFRNLFELQHVNLKDNLLSSWGPTLFYTPGASKRTLKSVDLSNNQIALVNKSSVQDLQHVNMLNLSSNPFACTCDMRWFRTWLDNTTVNVVNKTTFKCSSPKSWNGRPFMEFGPDKIDCTNYIWYYIGGAIGGTLVITVILFSVLYHQRWFIRLRIYRLGKALRHGNCCGQPTVRGQEDYEQLAGQDLPAEVRHYDFYIIAAEDDTDWVAVNLLPKLDNGPRMGDNTQNNPGQFSMYFEERDAHPAKNRIENFDENMPACRAALIVLTTHLKSDRWGCFLVDQAYELKVEEKIDRIQIVKVGRVPLQNIPRRLHKAMERRDYKEWPNKDTVEEDFVDYLASALQCGQGNGHHYDVGQIQQLPVEQQAPVV